MLLGAVDLQTGAVFPPLVVDGWPGPRARTFEAPTFTDALALPPRPNAEGIVVRCLTTGGMVKVKQADYVALHRVLTGTSARTLWQYMAVNACKGLVEPPTLWGSRLGIDPARAAQVLAVGDEWLETLLAKVPDEFYAWVTDTIGNIADGVEFLDAELRAKTASVADAAAGDRKRFAALVADHPHRGALFLLHDGRDITTYLWKQAYPPADTPWMKRSEDNA